MTKAESGDTVTITYEGYLEDGEIFDSSKDNGPLEFKIGSGSVLPAIDEGVVGMEVKETRTISSEPEKAFGHKLEDLIHTVDRSSWEQDVEISPGVIVGFKTEHQGEKHDIPATVTEVNGDRVTIDFNHPLAGKKLNFQVTVQDIKKGDSAE
ncbi:MAG: FKBP-type peptidyl-prolyl cis-trans isomerase [Thermodesulfobacteriota bacterium]